MAESQLDVLNRAPVKQAAEWLASCNGSGQRIEQVLAKVPLILYRRTGDAWKRMGAGTTDDDGISGFYPEVSISFRVTEPERHHHVPLLLSPFAYSTYRGS